MRRPILRIAFPLLALLALTAPARALEPVWGHLPPNVPADSLAPALQRLEARSSRSLAGSAAYALGQFHHARGDFRAAAEAFGRASARLAGLDRAEARYRQGAQEPGRARAAFEEVASASQPLRALAQLGLAQAHALAGETAREMDVLRRLLNGPAGEAEPAALERYAALCDQLKRPQDAAEARRRLTRRWPRSFEAARLGPRSPLVPS
jgi:hypothetical protein